MSSSEEASNALPPMDHDELDESHQEEEENDDDAVVTAAVATVQHGEGILDEKEADTNKESMSANTASNRTETPSEVYLIRNSQRDNRRLPEVTAHNKRVPIQTTTRIRRVGTTDGRHDKALASLSDDALAMARVVQSKHDEKWNNAFEKLLVFKSLHGHTLVPQCYEDDPDLGRFVHYQRVEYWRYQSTGQAKITLERIRRLQEIQFEWDPQRAKWNANYEKLVEFQREHGHCKVPKNWAKGPELANWVRNQRLENANRHKMGRKSRMTQERLDLLNKIGFTWSNPLPSSNTTPSNAEPDNTTQNDEQLVKRRRVEELDQSNASTSGDGDGTVSDAPGDLAHMDEMVPKTAEVRTLPLDEDGDGEEW